MSAALASALLSAGSSASAATFAPISTASAVYTVTSDPRLTTVAAGDGAFTAPTVAAPIANDYIAGYVGALSAHKATFTATLVVPTINCTHKPANPAFVNEYFNGTLAGGSQTSSGSGLELACTGTTANYIVYLDIDQQVTAEFATSPADTLVFTGTASATGQSFTVHDKVTGALGDQNGPGLTVHNLQLTAQGGYGATGGFPPFTPIRYTKLKADGSSFPALQPAAYEQVDTNDHVMVRPSPFYGNAFHLTFVTNS